MASSCYDARQKVLECLADSPLYNSGTSIQECCGLTKEQKGCKEFSNALYLCRRGQLDMRKRIKGNIYFQGEPGTEAATSPDSSPVAASTPSR